MKDMMSEDMLQDIIVYAVRYALGRRTTSVLTVCDFVKLNVSRLIDRTIACIERDIRKAPDLGDPAIDKPVWDGLRSRLLEEMEKRDIKRWEW